MIDNLKLLNISFNNKEPYVDEFYVKHDKPIITDNAKKFNRLMEANAKIIENITAYKIALESGNLTMQETILKTILSALSVNNINFSEFTNYWATKDMSYSVFNKILMTEEDKLSFLRVIIPEYIKDRHNLYNIHGYSFSTLQVVNDSKAHKKNGEAGIKKVSTILTKFGFTHFMTNDFEQFMDSDKVFIYPDKQDTPLFKEILTQLNINFEWSRNHENKQTDFLFKIGQEIFIMEHKHMKESGGGQDKQMSEIINFISYSDSGVHYIAFLDGVYFNLLADEKIKFGKPYEQKNAIYNNLKKEKQNFFVNTYGFNELIESFL